MQSYDTLVIGAGMSGLAAGIRIAQSGKRVAVLERHYLWGGLNSFYKRGGRRFDTGLHALTNFAPRGTSGSPLLRVLRALRIPYDALELGEQSYSETVFRVRGEFVRLRYSNDLALMRAEIARLFPNEVAGFDRLLAALPSYADAWDAANDVGARAKVREFIRDALLAEMLLVAPFYYGSASEHDLAWGDFAILFRSIHVEGMARPAGGIKRLLDLLVARLREAGGELRMQSGVREIVVENSTARGVVLDDGEQLACEHLLSSAGLVETRALCGTPVNQRDFGRISLVESLSLLEREPRELGHAATITFFNEGERFDYAQPAELVDLHSGVICAPSNYASTSLPADKLMRVTALANHERWRALDDSEYAASKERAVDAMLESATRFVPDFRPHTLERESFTPRTIERYTGHRGGAVYGSANKRRDGSIGVAGLHLIGADQGLVGVVGALLSGVNVANQSVLLASAPR